MSESSERLNVIGLRFELFVSEVAKTVRFYQATLGLNPPEGHELEGYVPLSSGVVTIGVQRPDGLHAGHHFSPANLAGPRGVGVEIVIEVADVDAAYLTASANAAIHGGTCEDIKERPWKTKDFRLIDPDGYYIRVTSLRVA